MATRKTTSAKIKVAFQGAHGAFSEQATKMIFGGNVEAIPCSSFRAVFEMVADKKIAHAVIPIENSLAGSVYQNYDLLSEFNLEITGEAWLRISHHLVAHPNAKLKDITTVISHPVALAQCEKFFRKNKKIASLPGGDTAGSIQAVVKGADLSCAAIGSSEAAKIYKGKILLSDLEDDSRNFTRFLSLQRPQKKGSKLRSGNVALKSKNAPCKTTISFLLSNKPGALFNALSAFALRRLDLSKIESRPAIGSPFQYYFHMDVMADAQASEFVYAIRHLQEISDEVKVYGTYEAAKRP